MTTYHPFRSLLLSRLREFFREPEAVFWVYGFPVLLAIGLGIAFREKPPERFQVDLIQDAGAASTEAANALGDTPTLVVEIHGREEASERLRMGKSDIMVVPGDPVEYIFDPMRPQSILARARVDDVLQESAGREDRIAVVDEEMSQPGSRYIDFLIPGLLGMNLMGGGLWGVGFVTVDMRVRKLLKRLVATPMRKSHFLMALIGSRLTFMIPEMGLLLLAGALLFQVEIAGSLAAVLGVSVLGAISFAGLGLLVACRAHKIETISGLMNLVMLPMWLFSGIFFSSDRFPEGVQPFINLLPLTMLNDALRAVILEGSTLASQAVPLGGLAAWGLVSFALGMRWFRWY